MTTTNKNFLSPIGFQFSIDKNKFSNSEYFCTGVSLPDMSIAESPMPYRGANIAFTGDRINFGDLSITFNITEDMENYLEMFNWMHRIVNEKEDQSEDAELLVLNSHSNVTKRIHFSDVFPIAITELAFDTQGTEVEYLQATVTFAYSTFEFK